MRFFLSAFRHVKACISGSASDSQPSQTPSAPPDSTPSQTPPVLSDSAPSQTADQRQYEHDFVMLTCSLERDMYRCLNAYQSFERFFEDSEIIPYYICVPERDLQKFEACFSESLDNRELQRLPIFLTERALMERAGEPVENALSLPGYYLQDALRLSFGKTGIARHYFMNDSDGYFIRKFDKSHLYQDSKLRFNFHEVWHAPKTDQEMQDLTDTFGTGHGNEEFINLNISYYDIQKMVKSLLQHHDEHYRNFTCTPCAFDSNVINDLQECLKQTGVGNFTNAIRMVPFAFQYYGEFLSKTNQLIPGPFLFFTVEPHIKELKVPRTYFDDPKKFGIQYQSVDYSGGNGGVPHDRVKPEITYIEVS